MDLKRFAMLAALVREALAEDKRTLSAMEAATTAWKRANETLTDRMKVFNEYVAQQKLEAITLEEK